MRRSNSQPGRVPPRQLSAESCSLNTAGWRVSSIPHGSWSDCISRSIVAILPASRHDQPPFNPVDKYCKFQQRIDRISSRHHHRKASQNQQPPNRTSDQSASRPSKFDPAKASTTILRAFAAPTQQQQHVRCGSSRDGFFGNGCTQTIGVWIARKTLCFTVWEWRWRDMAARRCCPLGTMNAV